MQGNALLKGSGGKPPAGVDVTVQGNALLRESGGKPPEGNY